MISDERTRSLDDSGFTLLEVLVALVLSSLLMIAVGGLFVFAGQLRDEVKATSSVEQALLDLKAVGSALNLWSTGFDAITLAKVSDLGFSEARVSNGAAVSEASVSLDSNPATKALTLDVRTLSTSEPTSVDLSTFDAAEIEYLVPGTQGAGWVHSSQLGDAKPRSIRLDLHKARRRWFIILWVDNGR